MTWRSVCYRSHSAGVPAAARWSFVAIRSWASRARPVCRMAATIAPTIGADRYSQASLKLPVATIGPSARAGLKAAPVRAPPMMMLRVNVIPIASGARFAGAARNRGAEYDRHQEKGEHGLDHEAGPGGHCEGRSAQSEVVRECGHAEARGSATQNGLQQ